MISYPYIFLTTAIATIPFYFCNLQPLRRQSPINLNFLAKHITLPKLVFRNHGTPASYTVFNNGSLVGVMPRAPQQARPTVEGGLLEYEHYLLNVHFHWADEDDQGSEHSFTGRRLAAEVHAVYGNSIYEENELPTAPDAYFVIALVIKSCSTGLREVDDLLKLAGLVKNRNSRFVVRKTMKPLAWRFPAFGGASFYIYDGSLTTSPFTENVQFAVRSKSLCASRNALAALRAADTDENVRNIQPRNGRPVNLAVF